MSMTVEEVDTSDIDLMDDPHIHAACAVRYPPTKQYGEYEGLCGVRATMLGTLGKRKCEDCKAIIREVQAGGLCPSCGKTAENHHG